MASGSENKNIVDNATGGHYTSRTIEDQLAQVVSQIAKEEEEYLAEQNTQKLISVKVLLESNLRMIKWSENYTALAGLDWH
ncbi:hypothetical protein V6N13_044367 [Hibiscus sabdariffa]